MSSKKTTAEMAKEIISMNEFRSYGTEILHYNASKGIYVGGEQGRKELKRAAYEILEKYSDEESINHKVNEMVGIIECSAKIGIELDEINNRSEFIPVNNGLLKISGSSVAFLPFTPDKVFTSKLAADYDQMADCPKFKALLAHMGDKECSTTIQELLGYILMAGNPLKVAVMIVGEKHTGKTTIASIIINFLGIDGCSSLSMSQMKVGNGDFMLSELYGKYANISDEVMKKAEVYSDTIKQLTGNSKIAANRKYLTPISFVNQAKLVFMCNNTPNIDLNNVDEAFWDRWCLVQTRKVFSKDERIRDYANMVMNDSREMSGILNLAIEYYKKLSKTGCFTYSMNHDWKYTRDLWMGLRDDDVSRFVNEVIEASDDVNDVDRGDVHNAYKSWCSNNSLIALSEHPFHHRFQQIMGIKVNKVQVRDNDLRNRVYRGKIQIKNHVFEIDKGEPEELKGLDVKCLQISHS